MLIDEKDASSHRCPRMITVGMGADSGPDKGIGGCMGSLCMAWRDVNTQRGVKGYCGLAGMPPGVAQPLLARAIDQGIGAAAGPNGRAHSSLILPNDD
jgi:hypothetical protein